MAVTSPKLTGLCLVGVPLVVAPIILFGRRVRKLSRESQDRIADTSAYAGEVLNSILTVQAFTLGLRLIGLAELYAGYPGAAEISAPQMAVNGAGWVALLMTWAQLKKLNRQTAAVFDQRIRELRANGR